MKKQKINDVPRISIDLLQLKPLKALEDVFSFYYDAMKDYFHDNGKAKNKFFDFVNCPICFANKFEEKIVVDNFVYVECDVCKAVYNNPQLKENYLKQMYESGEYATYFKKLVINSQGLRKGVIEQRKYEQIASCFDFKGRIIDIGCGSASFIKVCEENGWDVVGLDPSSSAKAYANETYNIDIVQSGFETYKTDKKFDCITFWGLEHLPEPMLGLEKAVTMLNDNGLIVFESPSADSFLMKHLGNNVFSPYRYIESARHVLFFAKETIEYIIKQYPLRLEYIESNGLDLQTILVNEITNQKINTKVMQLQQTIDKEMLGDHYRVFLRKVS